MVDVRARSVWYATIPVLSAIAIVGAYVMAMQWTPPDSKLITHHKAAFGALYESPEAPPYLYFGSSAAGENDRSATDTRRLADFFALELGIPRTRVAEFSAVGFQPEIFSAVYESLIRMPYPPRVLIVPIEMRAFSVPWLGHTDGFQILLDALKEPTQSRLDRTLETLNLRPRDTVVDMFTAEPHRVRVRADTPVPIRGSATMSFDAYSQLLFKEVPPDTPEWDRKVSVQLRAHYLTDLDERHLILQALIALGRLARRHHAAAVFYIAPVNVEDLRRYEGEDAVILERNVELVKRALARAGEPYVLDIHDLLGADLFADKRYSVEHLTAEGRLRRAQAVARYVAQQGLAGF